MKTSTAQGPFTVAILLLEQFAMLAFSSTIEPLREANSVAGRRFYEWKVLSHDGRPVRASNGLTLNVDGSIDDITCCQMAIVVSSFDPQLHLTRGMLAWLRRLAQQGAAVGAVETGAYVLARARLLNHYNATVHWENLAAFVEEFPKVRITGRIFEIDRGRFFGVRSRRSDGYDAALHRPSTWAGRSPPPWPRNSSTTGCAGRKTHNVSTWRSA